MSHILIVEDDPLFNEALCRTLEKAGYSVQRAYSLIEAAAHMDRQTSLLIVDIGLPDGTGLEFCRNVRQTSQVPVIFLTARDGEEDMIQAFDWGADDYLVKPFPMAVLLKHVEAVLRRSGEKDQNLYTYKDLVVDLNRKRVCRSGRLLKLTAREYQLLELLMRNAGKVVTKTMMLEQVWDVEEVYVEENTVNVTLNRLKKKIEPDPANPVYIKNVFGLGYTMEL